MLDYIILHYSPIIPHYSGIILEYQAASKFLKLFPHNSLRPTFVLKNTSVALNTYLLDLQPVKEGITITLYC